MSEWFLGKQLLNNTVWEGFLGKQQLNNMSEWFMGKQLLNNTVWEGFLGKQQLNNMSEWFLGKQLLNNTISEWLPGKQLLNDNQVRKSHAEKAGEGQAVWLIRLLQRFVEENSTTAKSRKDRRERLLHWQAGRSQEGGCRHGDWVRLTLAHKGQCQHLASWGTCYKN